MISQHDIDKIKSLPIEQVAEALGLPVERHRSLCPFHRDSHPSLHYRVPANRYRCFVCGHHGSAIDLAMEVTRLNFRDAVCWLAQTFGVAIDEEYRPFRNVRRRELKPVRKEAPVTFDPSRYAHLIAEPVLTEEARRFLFGVRKLNPGVVRWCGLSSTRDDLVIPYFGTDGSLAGLQWRYLGNDPGHPRFRFPKGSRCTVYNLNVLRLLKPSEPLYITEGCSDCWSMLSSGHKAVAVPGATLLKPQDLEPLEECRRRLGTTFHIFPDQDEPGERLFLRLREALPGVTRHQLPTGCKDYSDYYVQSGIKC